MEFELSEAKQKLVNDLTSGHQVILQRHGRSFANTAFHDRLIKYEGPNHKLMWTLDMSIRDSYLDPLGIQQCEEVQCITNHLKIHTIFISPLRRALQTTYHVYKSHPDFEKIKFIILPSLREGLNTSSDIPANINDTVREFSELFPHLDTTFFEEYADKDHNNHYIKLNTLYFLEDTTKEVRDAVKANL
jgi:hypothetical protein